MCNSSSSVLVLNRTSPSLLHTFVAYTTQLSIAIQHTRNSFYTHTSRVKAFERLLVHVNTASNNLNFTLYRYFLVNG